MPESNDKNVCVVVLGDIGHSPRMQYHVKSLLQHNFLVDLIGYVQSEPIKELISTDTSIIIHKLSPPPEFRCPRVIKYAFKFLWQSLLLLVTLFNIRRPNYLLIQNPPAVPALIVCYTYCFLFRCKLIIDWHNYTHTILALESSIYLKKKKPSPLTEYAIIGAAKHIESYAGCRSYHNLCVTQAMKNDLMKNFKIKNITVLYDRPFKHFQSISISEKHDLFLRLSQDYPIFLSSSALHNNTKENVMADGVAIVESTVFTEKLSTGEINLKKNRPGIIVSSTSWTPDENFTILINALDIYEEKATNDSTNIYPNLICIITGKGPLQQYYLEIIHAKKWKKISVITPWLKIADYPLVLAAADIGVSLHYSSSGLDLPMKIVDMFGCKLPVCAINFKCINELVKHERNGFIFNNEEELSEQLQQWFYKFPNNASLVNIKEIFQRNLREFQMVNWDENWNQNCLPIFTK